jgi:DNA (cytosine-5)-methyltransferase 1
MEGRSPDIGSTVWLGRPSLKLTKTTNYKMHELALFAGAGGGILGGKLLGWKTVCAVEWDEHARKCLIARQNDGCLDPFPIWDDVQTFDGRPWIGCVDIITGGFPCQDISMAGKGAGIDGEQSSMWGHMARIVGEIRPRYVLVENSPALTFRGLGRVLGDLARMGYDARWGVLGAHHTGAPHMRKRIWICAYADKIGRGRWGAELGARDQMLQSSGLVGGTGPWPEEAAEKAKLLGMDDGVADGLDRLARCGNGQVPAVVRLAWHLLCAPEYQGGRVGLPNNSLSRPISPIS